METHGVKLQLIPQMLWLMMPKPQSLSSYPFPELCVLHALMLYAHSPNQQRLLQLTSVFHTLSLSHLETSWCQKEPQHTGTGLMLRDADLPLPLIRDYQDGQSVIKKCIRTVVTHSRVAPQHSPHRNQRVWKLQVKLNVYKVTIITFQCHNLLQLIQTGLWA